MASGLRNIDPVLPDGTFYVLEYNGVRFDPAATETLGISVRPIQDDSKRTIKFVEYDISVKTVVYVTAADAASSIDATIDVILQKLTSQAGQLIYQGKGIGKLNVNISQKNAAINDDGVWDVAWGPTPYDVTAKPVGDTRAWEIVWNCRVSIPKCDSAQYQDAIMAFNYSVDYSTDYGGYTTRTIRGHLEVPMTRDAQGDRLLKHKDADKFREQIVINIPAGFRDAGGGSYTLSQDRRRLDFQAIHVQLPGVVPPLGVLKCSMSMKTQNQKSMNFVTWLFTIDATYEMASGNVQQLAAIHFRRVIVDRINRLQKITTNSDTKINADGGMVPGEPKQNNQAKIAHPNRPKGGLDGNTPGGAAAVIGGVAGPYANPNTPAVPTQDAPQLATDKTTKATNEPGLAGVIAGIVAKGGKQGNKGLLDELFSPDDMIDQAVLPKNCFVAPIFYTAEDPDAYGKPMAKFSCTLAVFGTQITLLNEGLWEPIKGTPNYNQWKKSLGNIWGSRGIAGLAFDESEDVIIDLCKPATESKLGSSPKGGFVNRLAGWAGQFIRQYYDSTGEEFTSYLGDNLWMTFQNDLKYQQTDNVVKTKKLPTDSALDGGVSIYSSQTVPDRWFENAGNQFNIVNGGLTAESQTKFENRVSPDYEVTMEGFAIKFGEPPDSPDLVSIGGIPCVPIDRVAHTEVIGNSFYPIYKTSWVKKYLLPQHKGTVVEPGSPEAASLRSSAGGGTSSLKAVGA